MFNLLKRIYPALVNYPKAEKYALAQDTKNCFYEYLTYVSRANNVKSKRLVYAQEAEAYLQKIKLNIMLAYHHSYNLIQSLLDRFDFLYLKKKGDKTVLKIDENKLKKDGD